VISGFASVWAAVRTKKVVRVAPLSTTALRYLLKKVSRTLGMDGGRRILIQPS
jgi:hypothetical protein